MLRKLAPGGVFVTQSGPAGFLSCREVFTAIHATLRSVFPTVVPYAQHIPSFCDAWGFNLAFRDTHQVRRAGRTSVSLGCEQWRQRRKCAVRNARVPHASLSMWVRGRVG